MDTKITAVTLLFSMGTCAMADSTTVYESVGPGGVPAFSGEMTPGARPERIESPNVITPAPIALPSDGSGKPPAAPPVERHINVTSPTPRQSIWSGSGDISVNFSPAAMPQGSHYQVYLDGQKRSTTTETSLTLSQVYRGEHRLQIKAVDESGNLLGQSPVVVFYVHRPIDRNPATRFNPH